MKLPILMLGIMNLCVINCLGKQLNSTGTHIHNYFLAQYKQLEGALPQANSYYEKILTHTDAPIQAYKGYAQFLALSNQHNKIIDLMPMLDKSFADDPIVQMVIIEALNNTNKQTQAADKLIQLFHHHPTQPEVAFHTAQAYMARHEPENAISVIDKFLDNAIQKPNFFMFYFLKFQIYLQLNKIQEALQSIKMSLKMHSNFGQGWFWYAKIKEQLGDIQEAVKGYTKYLDLVGHDVAVQTRLIQLLMKQKTLEEKGSIIKTPRSCLQKTLELFQQKQPQKALEELEQCLKKNPKDSDARLLKIQLLSQVGQVPQAVSCLTGWMLDEPDQELWFKTLHLMCKQTVKLKTGIQALHAVEKKYPHHIMPHLYLADLYLLNKQTPQALAYLKKIATESHDTLLQTKSYYQMGCIYYNQHHYESCKTVLTKGISLNSQFAPQYNLLAYYFAGKGRDLLHAQELISHALKLDSANPHYIDTQAYIYYKQQDYEKAYKLIESIAGNISDDPCIAKHAKKIRAHYTQKT